MSILTDALDELKAGLDNAIEAAREIESRLATFKGQLAAKTPAAIADKYEQAQTLLDQATATLADLKRVRENRIEDDKLGLEAWDLSEVDELIRDLEIAEATDGDD